MKSLGLIGGTSWHSTVEYYSMINQMVNDHFGDNTNPPLLVYTLNHAQIRKHQTDSNWEAIAEMIADGAKKLEQAGAEGFLFCANTPHKVYEEVQQQVSRPILHIADATAEAIKQSAIEKVCFLGTRYSMEGNFITERIARQGISIHTPTDPETITELHRIIVEELTYGKVVESSKAYVLEVIQSFIEQGAKGVVLGCTEFPVMIDEEDLDIKIFNTVKIHAKAGVKFILS